MEIVSIFTMIQNFGGGHHPINIGFLPSMLFEVMSKNWSLISMVNESFSNSAWRKTYIWLIKRLTFSFWTSKLIYKVAFICMRYRRIAQIISYYCILDINSSSTITRPDDHEELQSIVNKIVLLVKSIHCIIEDVVIHIWTHWVAG